MWVKTGRRVRGKAAGMLYDSPRTMAAIQKLAMRSCKKLRDYSGLCPADQGVAWPGRRLKTAAL